MDLTDQTLLASTCQLFLLTSLLVAEDVDAFWTQVIEHDKSQKPNWDEAKVLLCLSNATLPSVYWCHNGSNIQLLSDGKYYLENKDTSLEISGLRTSDNGLYTCTDHKEGCQDQTSVGYRLYINYIPSKPVLSISEGGEWVDKEMKAHCTLSDPGHPAPHEYRWQTSDNLVMGTTSTPTLTYTPQEVLLSFLCYAISTYGHSPKSDPISRTLKAPIRMESSYPMIPQSWNVIFTGSNFELACIISGTESHMETVIWTKDEKLIEANNNRYDQKNASTDGYFEYDQRRATKYSLILRMGDKQLQCEDMYEYLGQYSCTTPSNGLELKDQLKMKYPPLWRGPRTFHAVLNETNIILKCSVCGNPTPNLTHVKWRFEGGELPDGVMPRGKILIFPAITTDLYGNYSCSVVNPLFAAGSGNQLVQFPIFLKMSLPGAGFANNGQSFNYGLLLGIVAAILLLAICICVFICYKKQRKNKMQEIQVKGESEELEEFIPLSGVSEGHQRPVSESLKPLIEPSIEKRKARDTKPNRKAEEAQKITHKDDNIQLIARNSTTLEYRKKGIDHLKENVEHLDASLKSLLSEAQSEGISSIMCVQRALLKWKEDLSSYIKIGVVGSNNVEEDIKEIIHSILGIMPEPDQKEVFHPEYAPLTFCVMLTENDSNDYSSMDVIVLVTNTSFGRKEGNIVQMLTVSGKEVILVHSRFNEISEVYMKKYPADVESKTNVPYNPKDYFGFFFSDRDKYYNMLYMIDCKTPNAFSFPNMINGIFDKLPEDKQNNMAYCLTTPFSLKMLRCAFKVLRDRIWMVAVCALAVSQGRGRYGDKFVIVNEVEQYFEHLGLNSCPDESLLDNITLELLHKTEYFVTHFMNSLTKSQGAEKEAEEEVVGMLKPVFSANGLGMIDPVLFINTYKVLYVLLKMINHAAIDIMKRNYAKPGQYLDSDKHEESAIDI